MPIRDTPWPAGTPCWVDLAVPDLPAATAFYEAVLGWTVTDLGEQYGHYSLAGIDGNDAAGIGPLMEEGQVTAWTLYFATDDIAATAKLVTENGGSLFAEPMEGPGQGHMAVAVDPTGAVIGLWQATDMIGARLHNEPGGLVWEDGRSTDPEASRAFYTAVFGFTYDTFPGAPGGYGTFHQPGGGDPLGGLGGQFDAPEGTPSHWLVYFAVADLDEALQMVRDGDGHVVDGPDDSQFGRMATVEDPWGAGFALIQPPAGRPTG